MSTGAAAGRPVTLFGKLPSALDFVRINHDSAAAIGFDEWLQRAVQYLASRDVRWPAARFRFVFRGESSAPALVGVVGPSRDRAGRTFPVALFDAPQGPEAQSSALLVLGADRFLSDAEQSIEALGSAAASEVRPQLEALEAVRPSELGAAKQQLEHAMDREPAAGLLDLLRSPQIAADCVEPYESLLEAARALQAHPSSRTVVWDVLSTDSTSVALWLALHGSVAPSERGPCSLFWSSEESSRRLLLVSGAVPPALVFWLAKRDARSETLRSLVVACALTPLSASGPGRLKAEASVRELRDALLADV